jgi:Domain of unknown function (DUF4082)
MNKTNVVFLTLLAGLGGSLAQASTVAAVETTDGSSFAWRDVIGANQSATVGWRFTVGPQNLELTALGIYDGGADGLQTSHDVGIWTSGGANLAQVTVASGTAATLVGSYRYEAVAPLTLFAGQTYYVGAYFAPVVDRCGSSCGDEMLAFGTESYAPGVTYLDSRQTRAIIGAGPLSFPDLDAEITQGFFGPNFLLTAADPVATPEPAALGLAGFGLVLVAGAFRRTRHSK